VIASKTATDWAVSVILSAVVAGTESDQGEQCGEIAVFSVSDLGLALQAVLAATRELFVVESHPAPWSMVSICAGADF